MSFYEGLAQTALGLIKGKGQLVQIIKVSSDFDPVLGSVSNSSSDVQNCHATIFPLRSPNRLSKALNLDLVKEEVVEVICEAVSLTTAPEAGSILVDILNVQYTIVGVDPLAPAGIPVMYTLIAKKNSKPIT